ncbi:MAG: hypothetical protein F6K39_40870 [Okeania sp. SIO3B3]|nr:hypothetical protein [Okeania sp. SIO3B3]
MNSYTLEEGRQRAEGRRQKGKKSLKGEGFFITDYQDMILMCDASARNQE